MSYYRDAIGTPHDADKILEVYDSWQEFVDRADSPLTPEMTSGGTYGGSDERSSHSKGDSAWAGGSWSEVIKFAREGWPEGVKKINEIRDAVFAKTGSLIRKDDIYMEVSGAAIDIGTYLTGQPECFMDWQETDQYAPGKGKIVKMVVNVCASGGVGAGILFARGAMMVALADSLERAGRRAEIWIAMNSLGGEYRVLVKRPDQPVQIDQLAMAIAHPGSFRRLGFSVMEHWPTKVKQEIGIWPVGGGYGFPYSTKMEADITLASAAYGDSQWMQKDKAVEWVLARLKEQGIIVEDPDAD